MYMLNQMFIDIYNAWYFKNVQEYNLILQQK